MESHIVDLIIVCVFSLTNEHTVAFICFMFFSCMCVCPDSELSGFFSLQFFFKWIIQNCIFIINSVHFFKNENVDLHLKLWSVLFLMGSLVFRLWWRTEKRRLNLYFWRDFINSSMKIQNHITTFHSVHIFWANIYPFEMSI